jgi:hypothetical protein
MTRLANMAATLGAKPARWRITGDGASGDRCDGDARISKPGLEQRLEIVLFR